jgi:glutamyl-tRNA reductase
LAQQTGGAGPMLNPLFQRALAVGKQVMSETPLGEGRLSVASVAVDYARRIFDRFDDKTVLSIGAGKMSVLVLQHFAGLRPKRLLVCNRDPVKSAALAERFGGEAVPFERLDDHLVAADVVVTSTSSSQPIITREQFASLRKARRYRPIFLIDLAIPRDVEAGVGDFDNVYLTNLDDLQEVVSKTQSHRTDAIDAARKIVTEHVESFLTWQRTRQLGPLIDALSQRYHDVARAELERTLSKLPHVSEAERAQLEELTRRIVNKLLHDPITTLRQTDSVHGPTSSYLHALEQLFKLSRDDDEQSKST